MEELRQIKTDEHTISSGLLDVGDGHRVYFEQWGNANAERPILFLQGGPGYYFQPKHKNSFDPSIHQVIFFDQRGCGNSLPYGELQKNTTRDLVDDAVKILNHVGIEKVNVYGGSWGTTLALLFAIEYPQHTKATIVQAVFTGSQAEIDYIDKGVIERFYPEVWQRFISSVPSDRANNPAAYHYEILTSNDGGDIQTSAKALGNLEVPLLRLDWPGYPHEFKRDTKPGEPAEDYDPVPYRIYAHYLNNRCFLEDNYIIDNAGKIETPLFIVQGRYDMACPPITAFKIQKAVPNSKLFITLNGHSGSEPENHTALSTLIETVFI